MKKNFNLPLDKIATFCIYWQIVKLELFGSAAKGKMSDKSDYDFLVTFAPDAKPTLLTLAEIEIELGDLLGRSVDLVERIAIEQSNNRFRKKSILESTIIVYEEN